MSHLTTCFLALVLNVYNESGNQPIEGMDAVAVTTMNRVEHERFPNTIEKVVLQPYQFSWANRMKQRNGNGLLQRYEALQRSKAWQNPRTREAFDKAVTVASRHYLAHLLGLDTGRKPYIAFHTTKVRPHWVKGHKGTKIGDHIFYDDRVLRKKK